MTAIEQDGMVVVVIAASPWRVTMSALEARRRAMQLHADVADAKLLGEKIVELAWCKRWLDIPDTLCLIADLWSAAETAQMVQSYRWTIVDDQADVPLRVGVAG